MTATMLQQLIGVNIFGVVCFISISIWYEPVSLAIRISGIHQDIANFYPPKQRYGLLSWPDLLNLFEMESIYQLQQTLSQQVTEALANGPGKQDTNWSESIAVGGKTFLEKIKDQLGYRIKGKQIRLSNYTSYIREPCSTYNSLHEQHVLHGDHTFIWAKVSEFH